MKIYFLLAARARCVRLVWGAGVAAECISNKWAIKVHERGRGGGARPPVRRLNARKRRGVWYIAVNWIYRY